MYHQISFASVLYILARHIHSHINTHTLIDTAFLYIFEIYKPLSKITLKFNKIIIKHFQKRRKEYPQLSRQLLERAHINKHLRMYKYLLFTNHTNQNVESKSYRNDKKGSARVYMSLAWPYNFTFHPYKILICKMSFVNSNVQFF